MRASIINIKRSKEILNELEMRAIDGERFTVPTLIQEFFTEPGNPYQYLQCKSRVTSWLTNLKNRLTNKEGLWFGNINDNGEYGIAQTEAEVRYAQGRYYSLAKGIIIRAIELKDNAQQRGLLSGEKYHTELIEVPRLFPREVK